MKKGKIRVKNFAAGRKALFKRIMLYGASALAAYEVISNALASDSLSKILSQYPVYKEYIFPLLDNIVVYLGAAVIVAIIAQNNFSKHKSKIIGTDISVSLKVGDIFECDGGIIVPSNTIFAHDEVVIGKSSIQYQLKKRCDNKQLSADPSVEDQIQGALDSDEFKDAVLPIDVRVLNGKEYNTYPYGKIIPIKVLKKKKEKYFYLLSMSEILSEGRPHVDNEVLLSSIDCMWENIKRRRIFDDNLAVPLMGTGAAGMTEKPKHIVAKYLIKSFVNNAKQLGIKNMEICIYPGDYLNDEIDMDELKTYVDYVCRFPDSVFEKSK